MPYCKDSRDINLYYLVEACCGDRFKALDFAKKNDKITINISAKHFETSVIDELIFNTSYDDKFISNLVGVRYARVVARRELLKKRKKELCEKR